MIRLLIGAVLWAALALALVPGRAGAAVLPDDQGLAGRITAEAAGKTIQFPSLKTDVVADIQGDLATVTVTQTFVNPTVTALNAKYLFPLHKDAAVFAMTMEVGDEIVQAKIREREEARQTFEQGKREGKAAALLEQHRPNMFTQEIANLMPGDPIKVTLKYTQTVPRIDGAYELNVPLVVGPRYIPAGRTNRPQVAALLPATAPRDNPAADSASPRIDEPSTAAPPAAGVWQLGPVPSYPEVAGLTIPATVDTDRVSIRVNLASGMPITGVTSMTHALATTGDATSRTLTLAEGRIVDNRDFILRYTLSGAG
jgi:Ca-activated chloride channel homolog